MGQITIRVVGDASVGDRSKTYTFSDAAINRLVAWAKDAYATQPTAENPNPPALTAVQALVAWGDGLIEGTKNNVIAYEREKARQAVSAPAPVT